MLYHVVLHPLCVNLHMAILQSALIILLPYYQLDNIISYVLLHKTWIEFYLVHNSLQNGKRKKDSRPNCVYLFMIQCYNKLPKVTK